MPKFNSRLVLDIFRRLLAAFLALTWFTFPGFGLIDLSVTWDPDWPQVLEVGWGLYMTMFVGIPFTVIAASRKASVPATAQLYLSAASLTVSALAAAEWQLGVLSIVIVVETMIVTGLPSRQRFSPPPRFTPQPLLILAGLGLLPSLLYAINMWDLNRQDRVDSDITSGIDHYSVQGAFALTAVAMVALAALWPVGRLLMGTCAGLSAIYFGLVSWAWHPTQGSVNQTWGILCMLWGVIVVVLAITTRPSSGTTPGRDEQ